MKYINTKTGLVAVSDGLYNRYINCEVIAMRYVFELLESI